MNKDNGRLDRALLQDIDAVVEDAMSSLWQQQKPDGHWAFELEADVTISAEYIFLMHFLDDIDLDVQEDLAGFIRHIQGDHGGWPLFYGGELNISTSVKAYYALKLSGDKEEDPHMVKARNAILAAGGAERCNVFTRYGLALFGQVPWRAVPIMPVELMLMPKWFPIHMGRFSYWSRTVIAPLLILATLKPMAKNPNEVHIPELFQTPPFEIPNYLQPQSGGLGERFFLVLDKILKWGEHLFPKSSRTRALARAEEFFRERLNGEEGLGAIFPAMANSIMALDALGVPRDDPDFKTALLSVKKLLVKGEDGRRYCQPCVSPIWDTALATHAAMEAGTGASDPRLKSAMDWMWDKQILDIKGDWADKNPNLKPGGWAFQYENAHYPDTDDTAVVGMALHRTGRAEYNEPIERAAHWLKGMQSKNGGWGSFDIDNNSEYLNLIPFADHGALLDPPTSDVTARCLSFFAQLGCERSDSTIKRAVAFLINEQEGDGSWFGRWGTNYIYGTWSVLCAFNMVGEDHGAPHIRRAVDWLIDRQRTDGGWGEGEES